MRMIISTHRLEERPTCQVWMAAGPDWHKPGGDSGCPYSEPQLPLPLHGQCWAPDSTCPEHFQLLSLFWFLIHTRIQVWYLKLAHEIPRKSFCAAPLLMLVGFPLSSGTPWVWTCCGAVWRCPAPGRAAFETKTTHQSPSWSLHSPYCLSTSFRFTVLVGGLISQWQWNRFDFPGMTPTVVNGQSLLVSLCCFSWTSSTINCLYPHFYPCGRTKCNSSSGYKMWLSVNAWERVDYANTLITLLWCWWWFVCTFLSLVYF